MAENKLRILAAQDLRRWRWQSVSACRPTPSQARFLRHFADFGRLDYAIKTSTTVAALHKQSSSILCTAGGASDSIAPEEARLRRAFPALDRLSSVGKRKTHTATSVSTSRTRTAISRHIFGTSNVSAGAADLLALGHW